MIWKIKERMVRTIGRKMHTMRPALPPMSAIFQSGE